MGNEKLSDWETSKGYEVNLQSAVIKASHKQKLHDPQSTEMELNIKIDDRPFFGNSEQLNIIY